MSRRAKESDASLAFSTTTIDDVMMMSFFGYFLPLLCVFWIFFCVFWWISFCFCVRKSSILLQCRPKQQCVLLYTFRKNSLFFAKKKKIKKEKRGTKKKTKMLCSSRLPFAFFFLSPPKKKILSFFDRLCPTFLCVALRLHQRKERSLKKRLERPFDARTHKTNARKRETHTHTHTEREREREREKNMGKRKSKAPPPKKVQPKLDTTFTCPFCNHEKSVSAKLDFQQYKGLVECSVCGQKYACKIDDLSAAIDVYSDWIDACERLNAPGGDGEEEEEEDEEVLRKERELDAGEMGLKKKIKKKKQKTGTRKDDQYEKDFIDSEDDEEDASDTSESDSDA